MFVFRRDSRGSDAGSCIIRHRGPFPLRLATLVLMLLLDDRSVFFKLWLTIHSWTLLLVKLLLICILHSPLHSLQMCAPDQRCCTGRTAPFNLLGALLTGAVRQPSRPRLIDFFFSTNRTDAKKMSLAARRGDKAPKKHIEFAFQDLTCAGLINSSSLYFCVCCLL